MLNRDQEFPGPPERPGRLAHEFGVIHRSSRVVLDRLLRDHPIAASQIGLYGYLLHHGPASQEELATQFRLDKGAVARSLARMEQDGLVQRRPDPANRRQNQVAITPAGEALRRTVGDALRVWETALVAGFTPAERETLLALLGRLCANAETAVERTPPAGLETAEPGPPVAPRGERGEPGDHAE